jgi:hypothetical protein
MSTTPSRVLQQAARMTRTQGNGPQHRYLPSIKAGMKASTRLYSCGSTPSLAQQRHAPADRRQAVRVVQPRHVSFRQCSCVSCHPRHLEVTSSTPAALSPPPTALQASTRANHSARHARRSHTDKTLAGPAAQACSLCLLSAPTPPAAARAHTRARVLHRQPPAHAPCSHATRPLPCSIMQHLPA